MSPRRSFLPALGLLVLAACGGSIRVTEAPDAAGAGTPSGPDGGSFPPMQADASVQPLPPGVVPVPDAGTYCGSASLPASRTITKCNPSSPLPPPPPGSPQPPPVACALNADCVDAGGPQYCRAQTCQWDQCISDNDCPPGTACACASQFGGNAPHVNLCITSTCRSDADCGAGGVCEASMTTGCSTITGYYCRTLKDTCKTSADCCSSSPVNLCGYQPALGYWACESGFGCSG